MCVGDVSYATPVCFHSSWIGASRAIYILWYVRHRLCCSQWDCMLKAKWMNEWFKLINSSVTLPESHCSQMTPLQIGEVLPSTATTAFPSDSFNWLVHTLQAIPLLFVLPQPHFHRTFVFYELLNRSLLKAEGEFNTINTVNASLCCQNKVLETTIQQT